MSHDHGHDHGNGRSRNMKRLGIARRPSSPEKTFGYHRSEILAALAGVDGIVDVHDLHIWTITSGFESLSVHARIEGRDRSRVLREVRRIVRERFGIEHSTVQLEEEPEECDEGACA